MNRSASIMEFLHVLERLKCNTRHCDTTNGRRESVADHIARAATLAMLLRAASPEIDTDRVIRLLLVHDFGEAVTGDVPCFDKTEQDEQKEARAWYAMTECLPSDIREDILCHLTEFEDQKTPEARLARAIDKIEGVIQHNESDLRTWLPLERELNLVYGKAECAPFLPMQALRDEAIRETEAKLAREG